MTSRSLLMRVLLLPHGNGKNPELDQLCVDILAHCSHTADPDAVVTKLQWAKEDSDPIADIRAEMARLRTMVEKPPQLAMPYVKADGSIGIAMVPMAVGVPDDPEKL